MPGKERKEIKIAFLVVLLDQFTKILATKYLSLGFPFPVIKNILSFTLVYNQGAAFGVLKNQTPFFIIASVFAVILIVLNLKANKHKQPLIYSISLSFILAGAIGNLIDRLRYGYVIDFIDLHVWPVFNIADSAITIGAILLGWSILFKKDAS